MELPMARVKKIMKIDDDVRQQMISQDAPLFLSACAEIFIQEVTLKSWAIVEEGRRKTLQKVSLPFSFLVCLAHIVLEREKKDLLNLAVYFFNFFCNLLIFSVTSPQPLLVKNSSTFSLTLFPGMRLESIRFGSTPIFIELS